MALRPPAVLLPAVALLALAGCSGGSAGVAVAPSVAASAPGLPLGAAVRVQVPPMEQSVRARVGDRVLVHVGVAGARTVTFSPPDQGVLIDTGDAPPLFHLYAQRAGSVTVQVPVCGQASCPAGGTARLHVTVLPRATGS